MQSHPELTVFFDGKCYLCTTEIALYSKQDKEQKIRFVDFTSPAFDPAREGVKMEELVRSLQARSADGKVLSGLDSFLAIWQALGRYRFLTWLVSRRALRPLLDFGYRCFAQVRPWLPQRSRSLCQGDTCDLRRH